MPGDEIYAHDAENDYDGEVEEGDDIDNTAGHDKALEDEFHE